MRVDARTEELLRALTPQVLGVLIRRHGQFDACEDAVQEALLDAAVQWPERAMRERSRKVRCAKAACAAEALFASPPDLMAVLSATCLSCASFCAILPAPCVIAGNPDDSFL